MRKVWDEDIVIFEKHFTYPNINELKQIDLLNSRNTDTSLGYSSLDLKGINIDLYSGLLGNRVAVLCEHFIAQEDLLISVKPRQDDAELCFFNFILRHNDVSYQIDGQEIEGNSILFFNNCGTHSLYAKQACELDVLQIMVSTDFIAEYVPRLFLGHSSVQDIIFNKDHQLAVFSSIPQFLRSELNKIYVKLNKNVINTELNKMKLLNHIANFMDLFFRVYLGQLRGEVDNLLPTLHFKTAVHNYLEKNIGECFAGIDELAAMFNLSPSSFKRLFKQNFGTSALQYFRKLQMDKARDLLEKEEYKNVNSLAYEFNFSSVANFIRCYKKYQFSTPGEVLIRNKLLSLENVES